MAKRRSKSKAGSKAKVITFDRVVQTFNAVAPIIVALIGVWAASRKAD